MGITRDRGNIIIGNTGKSVPVLGILNVMIDFNTKSNK